MASRLPNIDHLTLSDLNDLDARVQKAIAARKDEERAATMSELRALASSKGFTLDELMGRAVNGRRQRSDKGVKLKPKYKGPNGEIYTGRGPTPKWLKALERKGEKREKFLVR
jgi:DNA-binding protein H-NS